MTTKTNPIANRMYLQASNEVEQIIKTLEGLAFTRPEAIEALSHTLEHEYSQASRISNTLSKYDSSYAADQIRDKAMLAFYRLNYIKTLKGEPTK